MSTNHFGLWKSARLLLYNINNHLSIFNHGVYFFGFVFNFGIARLLASEAVVAGRVVLT